MSTYEFILRWHKKHMVNWNGMEWKYFCFILKVNWLFFKNSVLLILCILLVISYYAQQRVNTIKLLLLSYILHCMHVCLRMVIYHPNMWEGSRLCISYNLIVCICWCKQMITSLALSPCFSQCVSITHPILS